MQLDLRIPHEDFFQSSTVLFPPFFKYHVVFQDQSEDYIGEEDIIPFSANFIKWSNTLKQFVGNLPTNCSSVFDHFVGLALKRLLT